MLEPNTTSISKFFKLKTKDFINLYCDKSNEFIHLKETKANGDCQFLINKRCSVYKARPTQCRTWPFWSENMNAKTWNKEISKFCPGVGKGKIITDKQIKKKISLDEKNENEMLNEIN